MQRPIQQAMEFLMRRLVGLSPHACSPFEVPFIRSGHFPSPPWERKKTSIKTLEREGSGVKLKTEDVTVYFSLAF